MMVVCLFYDFYGQVVLLILVGMVLIDEFVGEEQEMVVVMCIDVYNKIIVIKWFFIGGISECFIYFNQVFCFVIKIGVYGVILVYNYLFGFLVFLMVDMIFIKWMEEVGKLIGIVLIDVFVVGRRDYYSWCEVC